jgi:hypothetical protein
MFWRERPNRVPMTSPAFPKFVCDTTTSAGPVACTAVACTLASGTSVLVNSSSWLQYSGQDNMRSVREMLL